MQADSRLARGLRRRFGADTPVDAVNWGGWNRVSTRSKGAAALARHLREAPLAPGQRRFVIAHSHGGNVALYALRDRAAAARTAGVATLATPFLVAGRRAYSDRLSGARAVLLGAVAVLLIALAGGAADRLGAGAPTAVGWLVFALIAGGLLFALHRVARAWDGFADRVVESMQFGDLGRERLLVMRSPGDEASVILLSSRVLLAMGMVLMRLLAQVCGVLERALLRSRRQPWFGWAFGAAVLAGWLLLLVLAAQSIEQDSVMSTPLLIAVGAGGLLLLPVAMHAFGGGDTGVSLLSWHYLLGAALLAAVILPSLLLVLYGWQLAVANLEVDVSAEATPPGDWRVITLAGQHAFGDDAAAALTHSALYDDERAIGLLCDWVEQVLADETRREAVSKTA